MFENYGVSVLLVVGVALTACSSSGSDAATGAAGTLSVAGDSGTTLAGSSSTTGGDDTSSGGSSVTSGGSDDTSGGSDTTTAGGSDSSSGGTDTTSGGSDSTSGGSDSTSGGSDSASGGSDSTSGGSDSTSGGTADNGGSASGGESNAANCPPAQPTPKSGDRCTELASATDRCTYATVSCACVVPTGGPAPGRGGAGGAPGGERGTLQCRPVRAGGGEGGAGPGRGAGGAGPGRGFGGEGGGGQCRGLTPKNGAACTGSEICRADNRTCTCTASKWACR